MNSYLQTVVAFATTLKELGIPYAIVGSVASSAHGEQRATNDADFLADLRDEQAVALVARLGDEYYIDLASVRRAISHSRSFNVIELASMFKIDVFVVGGRASRQVELANARAASLGAEAPGDVMVASPEDTVVAKLQWYRKGGEVSEKQWNDVLGVLRVQRGRLDDDYLFATADEQRVRDLLDRAVAQVEAEERALGE